MPSSLEGMRVYYTKAQVAFLCRRRRSRIIWTRGAGLVSRLRHPRSAMIYPKVILSGTCKCGPVSSDTPGFLDIHKSRDMLPTRGHDLQKTGTTQYSGSCCFPRMCKKQGKMKRVLLTACLARTILTQSPAPRQESACTRESLLEAADAYVTAQEAGSIDALAGFLADDWIYRQDNDIMPATEGVLTTTPLTIDHRRTTADVERCASYTELISADAGSPYVIGTQIRLEGGKITLVDSVASTTNSWFFDAAKTLGYVQDEDWFEIDEADRDDRDVIQAAGDAYLDMWSNSTAKDAVPWGRPCTRIEGSAYTGSGSPDDSCELGTPSNSNQAPNSDRRYVVDEVFGSVSILCVWEHMMNAADSHEFRLEGGKLRYVHTMTVCGGQACRL